MSFSCKSIYNVGTVIFKINGGIIGRASSKSVGAGAIINERVVYVSISPFTLLNLRSGSGCIMTGSLGVLNLSCYTDYIQKYRLENADNELSLSNLQKGLSSRSQKWLYPQGSLHYYGLQLCPIIIYN